MKERIFGDTSGTKVKICGVRSLKQSRYIINLGVDALGFNFWPNSKRYLDSEEGADWLPGLAGVTIRVGVFVNESPERISDLLNRNLIDWAQLHGNEPPEMLEEMRQDGFRVFKAFGVKDRETMDRQLDLYSGPILLDAYAPNDYGGSGKTMDWKLGAEAVSENPDREVILAGGLKPENVADAVEQVHPAAVDVASGVESGPGVKDLEMCRTFIKNAKE